MRRPLMKVLLVFSASLGITGMFLYKFKYEQMKAIVEGAGLAAVDQYLHAYHLKPLAITGNLGSQFENPATAWNNITEHFVFSAFNCHQSASTPAVGTTDFCGLGYGPDSVPTYECSVLFDLGREVLSMPGTFTFTSQPTDGSANLMYEFKCSVKNLRPIHRNPYALILKKPDHKNKVLVPIYKPVASAMSRFVVCTYPDIMGNDWQMMMEFLAYHDILGITDVIAYDNGINRVFLHKLKYFIRSRTKGSLKSLSVLHWDFPSNDPNSNLLVQRDCAYRTSGIANLTAVLNWNQFIVSKDSHCIKDAVADASLPSKPLVGRVNSMRCCTDSFDDRRSEASWPTILKKTLCIPNKELNIFYINPSSGGSSAIEHTFSFIDVMTYGKCQGLALSELVPVFSMWTHLSEIQSSDLLKSWRQSDLFSIMVT